MSEPEPEPEPAITAGDVREVLGLSNTDAPDAEITPYIDKGIRNCLLDIGINKEGAILVKKTPAIWYAPDSYIADTNLDGQPEVVVYSLDENDDKVYLEVSTVKNYNKIVLVEPTTEEVLYADYISLPNKILLPDMKDLCVAMTAYLYVCAELLLLPDTLTHGALRFKTTDLSTKVKNYYFELRDRIVYGVTYKQAREITIYEV